MWKMPSTDWIQWISRKHDNIDREPAITLRSEVFMSSTIIIDNEFITIQYYPKEGIIHHTIHKPISGQPFRDAFNTATDFLRDNGVTKWLSDDRKNGPLPPEDLEWGQTDWNQRAMAAGWKYWAVVVPEDIAAAGTFPPVIEDFYQRGLRLMVFTDIDDAMNWLDSME